MSKTLYFGIARHNLTVVAMDGSPITKPFTTDYVKLSIQQSADCIFEANQQPDHYYMVAGTNVGQTHDMNKTTTAIIEYQGNYTPSSPPLLPLLPNLSPNYDKSSSRNYLNVIMTFVILGLLFCTALVVVWNRRPRRPHRSAMVAPL
uniref:Putative ovule protein n=1 Tax=Solanum chacoense TaxID=4108 RepID=A0A0V0H1S3_SOLCH